MSGDRDKDAAKAKNGLERGLARSRRVVARYRARLLVLREAMERQSLPQMPAGRRRRLERG